MNGGMIGVPMVRRDSAARRLVQAVTPERFDGNYSDPPTHWWFIDQPVPDSPAALASGLDALCDLMRDGAVNWVIFPTAGLRL